MTKLHPAYVEFLEKLKAEPTPLMELPIEEARPLFEERFRGPDERMEGVAKAEEWTIEGPYGEIPLCIYWPESQGEKLPICLYFHGGGWVFGSPRAYERPCRQIASRTPCIVVAVDYRKAPEFGHPVAIEEVYAATVWAAQHAEELGGDPARIAVSGGSVGGTMAAVVPIMARDRGGPDICFSLVCCPVAERDFNEEEVSRCLDQTMLTPKSMAWYWNHYAPEPSDDPYLLPIYARELGNLPPTFFVLAEHDILTPGALRYLEALEKADVAASGRVYDHMIHSFFDLPVDIPEVDTALNEALAHLRQAFDAV